jgi:rubrerythrin
MTVQEAKEILYKTEFAYSHNKTKEAMKIAFESLEKQIPKTPNIEGDGYCPEGHLVYDTWICPNCGKYYEIDYDDYDYCPNCGQAINKSFMEWGEEDD